MTQGSRALTSALPRSIQLNGQKLMQEEERGRPFAPVFIYSKGLNTLSPWKQLTKAGSSARSNPCLLPQRWLGLNSGVGYPASSRPGVWILCSWAGCSGWKIKLLGFRWPQPTTQRAPPRLLYSEITLPTEERVAGCLNLGPTLGTACLLYR